MLVYNYHPVTFEYLGCNEANPNPREEGKFLCPAHATFVEQLLIPVDGKYVVFDIENQQWVYQDIPVEEVPEPTLDEIKNKKIVELKMACQHSIINEFYSSCLGESKRFDCDDYDQRNILGLVAKAQLILSGAQTDGLLEWRTSDDDICYPWTPQQVIQLGSDMYTHISENIKKSEKLVKSVKIAKTKEEVDLIVW